MPDERFDASVDPLDHGSYDHASHGGLNHLIDIYAEGSSSGAGSSKDPLSNAAIVFRVPATRLDRSIGHAVFVSIVSIGLLALFTQQLVCLAALPAWPLWTWARSKRVRADYCCDPGCDSPIPLDSEDCPGCKRPVRGEIAHRDHRLEAEEQVARAGYGFKPSS